MQFQEDANSCFMINNATNFCSSNTINKSICKSTFVNEATGLFLHKQIIK